jgi:serine/threonine protein kinase
MRRCDRRSVPSRFSGGKLDLGTTLRLADQMIERCADMHLIGVLHNDIKPQNFVMGLGAHADLMYVVDFGLADRLEYDPVAMSHILQSSGCGDVKGTKAFQSMRAHQGKV